MSEGTAIRRQEDGTADVESALRAWGDLVVFSEVTEEPRSVDVPRVLRLSPC